MKGEMWGIWEFGKQTQGSRAAGCQEPGLAPRICAFCTQTHHLPWGTNLMCICQVAGG